MDAAHFVHAWVLTSRQPSNVTITSLDHGIAQMVKQQFPGEQLAYITALAVGAELVFGDRCKSITYQRLQNIPSLKDLDAAYGRLSADNYQDLLHKKSPSASASQSGRLDADGSNDSRGHADCVRTILTSERDLVLASSMIKAAEHVGKEGRVAAVVGAFSCPAHDAFDKQ